MTEYHMILIIKNLVNSAENSDESFVDFHLNFVIRNCCDDTDQNFYSAAELYFSLF